MLYVYMYICTCILHYAQSGLNGGSSIVARPRENPVHIAQVIPGRVLLWCTVRLCTVILSRRLTAPVRTRMYVHVR